MTTEVLDPTPKNLRRAAARIRDGGVVLSPSDTNMALGVDPRDEAAIARVYDIKGRRPEKPLPLFVRDPAGWRRYGRPDEAGIAEDTLDFALEAAEEGLERSDPLRATPMLHLGDILSEHLGQPGEAESLFRQALAIQERLVGQHDLVLIHGLHSLGTLLGQQGRHEEAEHTLDRAIEILHRAFGPDHPRTAGSHLNLAQEYVRQGRHAEADALYRTVIRVWEQSRGPRHPSVANARAALATGLVAAGRLQEAEVEARTALSLREESLGRRGLMAGLSRTLLGDILRRKSDTEAARRTLQEARAILLENLEPGHPQVREVEIQLDALDLERPTRPSTSGRGF